MAGLWEEAAGGFGVGYGFDGDGLGGGAVADAVAFGVAGDFGEGGLEHGLESGDDFALGPAVVLEVLHPLEIGDRDATGIAEHVGDDEDIATSVEDAVGLWSGGAVRTFGEDAASQLGGVFAGDDAVEGAGGEDVARLLEEQGGIDGFRLFEADDAARFGDVFAEFGDIEAIGIPDRAVDIGDAGDFHPVGGEGEDRVRSDVAETLDDGAGPLNGCAEFVECIGGKKSDSMAGGAGASAGALEVERLAGDDGGNEVAGMGGIGIRHPGHGLLVGAHVRGHNIDFRADEGDHLHRETAGKALQLAGRHAARVAGDAAFSSTEGQVHERAFPGHPHGERGDFPDVHRGMVAESALGGAAGEVVLHAMAEKYLRAAIVAQNGHGDGDEPFGPFAALAQTVS